MVTTPTSGSAASEKPAHTSPPKANSVAPLVDEKDKPATPSPVQTTPKRGGDKTEKPDKEKDKAATASRTKRKRETVSILHTSVNCLV